MCEYVFVGIWTTIRRGCSRLRIGQRSTLMKLVSTRITLKLQLRKSNSTNFTTKVSQSITKLTLFFLQRSSRKSIRKIRKSYRNWFQFKRKEVLTPKQWSMRVQSQPNIQIAKKKRLAVKKKNILWWKMHHKRSSDLSPQLYLNTNISLYTTTSAKKRWTESKEKTKSSPRKYSHCKYKQVT